MSPKAPKFIGGRSCLDFVNTVGARVTSRHRILREKLIDYQALLSWAKLGGVLAPNEARNLARRASSHPRDAAAVLARALKLREALYRIFKCMVEDWQPENCDVATLSGELSIAKAHEKLARSGGGFVWAWDPAKDHLDRVLWPIARSAADLLISADLSLLRQCGGQECGWLFLDTSRNRRRQWCDMRDCGNRAKVRRFRQRQRKIRRTRG
jgi:predicted RNA-binding Zn ribbon-like protein